MRIHLESEAILAILQQGQMGIYKIVGSNILELEIDRMNNAIKKQRVKELYEIADMHICYTEKIKNVHRK